MKYSPPSFRKQKQYYYIQFYRLYVKEYGPYFDFSGAIKYHFTFTSVLLVLYFILLSHTNVPPEQAAAIAPAPTITPVAGPPRYPAITAATTAAAVATAHDIYSSPLSKSSQALAFNEVDNTLLLLLFDTLFVCATNFPFKNALPVEASTQTTSSFVLDKILIVLLP